MTSFKKGQQFYNHDFLKDIINQSSSKKNNNENSDDNFWDVGEDEEDTILTNLNLFSGQDKYNKINGYGKKNNEKEKDRIINPYDLLSKPKQEKTKYNFYLTKKSKTIQPNEKKKNRPNSVDINCDKPKAKMKTIKIDELSVFKRNQKWLQKKNDNINKQIEKMINKKEKEINEYKRHKYINKPTKLDNYNIFREEYNVKYKPENINFLLRLRKVREEKYKTPSNIYSGRINFLKYSHYSGIQENTITQREMNKCIKYIHDKLKGKK